MHTLTPDPSTLGIQTPQIGPWFSSDTVELPVADDRLAVPLTLDGGVAWLPPAGGLLSFRIATPDRPRRLAGLRDGAGEPAFDDGHLVAEFRLLPEVEARIDRLMRVLPTLAGDDAAGEGRTRPRVRTFALEIMTASPSWTMLESLLPATFGLPGSSTAENVAHVGLTGTAPLGNGPKPMGDLKRTGKLIGAFEQLLHFPTSTDVKLWAFDHRGRALDPGAVACWWLFLATHADNGFDGLWAEGLETGDQRTAPIATDADELVLHLVDPQGGAPLEPTLARIDGANLDGTGTVRRRGAEDEAATLSFTDPPTDDPDDLPVPRMALLPDGVFGETVSVWPTGTVDPILRRDFARVAALSVELALTGQRRTPAPGSTPTAADERRAEDQARTSTRVSVARAERTDALLDTHEEVIAGFREVFEGPEATDLATGVLEAGWGPITPALPDEDPPTAAPDFTVEPLQGGGVDDGGTVVDQKALVTSTLDASLEGAWVRVWTQGFDRERAEHFKMDGGAGRVADDGTVRLVTRLPDGAVDPSTPMGMDVMVVTDRGARHFADVRFDRPAPVGGDPAALTESDGTPRSGTTSGLDLGSAVVVCETGVSHASLPLPDDSVPSGSSLVALTSPPTLVDASTLPTAARVAALGGVLEPEDRVRLVEPAFQSSPRGDAAEDLAPATVHATDRRDSSAWESGFPLPSMERLESVASNVGDAEGRGAVGAVPALSRYHDFLHHRHGNPNAPAAPDTHGTGVRVRGPAARLLAEYARDRTSESTLDLVARAATPVPEPSDVDGDALWIAGLRTVAAGVEGEVGLGVLADASIAGFDPYPLGDAWTSVQAWIEDKIGTLPSELDDTTAAVDSIVRALDRRFLAATRGAREGATSLQAALGRAQDIVYIETPAFDARAFDDGDDRLDLWSTLVQRMKDNRALHLVICAPVWLLDGAPAPLQRVRDAIMNEALSALQEGSTGTAVPTLEERVATFSPAAGPGRSLRIASTSVVVDDAYAFTGSTHLWRRGLSFDSSYAVAAFDERVRDGRPAAVTSFRRRLLAGRLGVELGGVPDDPVQIVRAVRDLSSRGGFGRLAAERIRAPDPTLTTSTDPSTISDVDLWDPDGSPPASFNPVEWIAGMLTTVQTEELTPAP
ncbi:MAG: hypothetical protein U5R14_07735 [Gemmatimonadota bacterium]|nr:hypothetical protein [Gemmatimonadota bacterium]